jgi:uncharacterized protein YhaN
MRLRRLDLTRYGKFTDHVLDLGEAPATGPDLQIVYGANEAGKSTVLDAYLSLLFGIAHQTRYGFLHPDALRIGGSIASGGRSLELVRTKGRTNDLRGADDQPLPPGTLDPILGGMTRDVYQHMFSLNDRTLTDGGREILESRGELGAMLFAATSGLSEISAALNATRAVAETLHKPRARSTRLRTLLDRLTELKAEQQAIDVQADRFERLRSAVDSTRIAHETAFATRQRLVNEHALADRLRRALPVAARYRAHAAERAQMPERPPPPPGWVEAANTLISDEASLTSRLRDVRETLERLRLRRDELPVNQTLLNAAAVIEALDAPRGRERAAQDDLPKRLNELDELKAAIGHVLTSLGPAVGASGLADPSSLILPTPVVAEIERCMDQHAVLLAALEKADEEMRHAKLKLEQDSARVRRDATVDVTLEPGDVWRIEEVLQRITDEAPQREYARVARAVEEQQAKLDGLLDGLRPFRGSREQLRDMAAPTTTTVTRWGETLMAAEAEVLRAAQRLTETQEAIAAADARAQSLLATAALVDETSLRTRTADRQASWSALLAGLEKGGAGWDWRAAAEQYSKQAEAEVEAFRHNLRHAGAFGQWQATAVTLAEARAAEPVRAATHFAAVGRRDAVIAEINDALIACGLPSGMPADAFAAWLGRRLNVLAEYASLDALSADKDRLDEVVREVRTAIVGMLRAHDAVPAEPGFTALRDAARRLLAAHAEATRRREAADKQLASLAENLTARSAQHAAAADRLSAWQQHWRAAVAGTWLANIGGLPPPASVKAALAALSRLAPLLQAHAELHHRIARMQEDQAAFRAFVDAAHATAQQTPGSDDPLPASDALQARLQAERQQLTLRTTVEDELARAEAASHVLSLELAELSHRRAGMFAHYGVTTAEDLRTALDEARRQAELGTRLTDAAADLLMLTGAASLEAALDALVDQDADSLTAQVERLEADIAVADAAVQHSNHARLSAEQAYRDVGGDDRVARIMEQRRTVELELEDAVHSYLRLKIGVEAVDAALKSYRDRHRSGMIEDASRRFRHMTGGSFTDLRTQASGKGEILVGIRAGGGSLETEKMSQGTRDQLFLALRMAGYAEFARTREPLPFVADDIMETFDDDRAAATFRMLADVATEGQVIYLTHHRHLCDIARDVCASGVRVVEL